MFWEYIINQQK